MEKQPEEFPFVADFSGSGDSSVSSILVKDKTTGNDITITLSDGKYYKQMYGRPVEMFLYDENKRRNVKYETYSIEGEFDAQESRWRTANVRVRDLEEVMKGLDTPIVIKQVYNWRFSLRDCDGLFGAGQRIFPPKPQQ
jgi:hypothetical protein